MSVAVRSIYNAIFAVLYTLNRMGVFLVAGQVEIGVNDRDDCDSSSQEGLRSWSDSSHTEPLSMTVSRYSVP